jgi:hypothetical protein
MANLQNLTPWKPGQSRNLNGRPVGSRTVFSQAFLKDLAEVWSDEGREAMLKTAKTNPTVFFATCARLIGPEVKLTIEQALPGNLSMEDWQTMKEVIAAVRQAIPDASSKPPGAVFEHVLGALGATQAKPRYARGVRRERIQARPPSRAVRPPGLCCRASEPA